MRVVLKPLGLTIVVLAIIGLAVYAVYWQMAAAKDQGLADSTPAPAARAEGSILVVTSATKLNWVNFSAEKFNAANKGKMTVEVRQVEARQALQEILNGQLKPVLWVPDNAIWGNRLAEAWAEQNGGKPLLNVSSMEEYRSYLRTPLVFLTTREKAEFLRPLLKGTNPWGSIRDLCSGKKNTPWGGFRYIHSDPTRTDTGFLTVAMLLTNYADAVTGGDYNAAVTDPGLDPFLEDLKKGFVSNPDATGTVNAPVKAFAADPQIADLVITYESEALKVLEARPELVVIYPEPTIVSEVSAAILSKADWVTAGQKAVAARFMESLGEADSIRNGIFERQRPIRETSDLTVAPLIKKTAAQGAQETFSILDTPPYDSVNEALGKWRKVILEATPAD